MRHTKLHPWHQQKELVALCHRQKIAVQAYCSIVRNQRADDPGLCIIADRYSKTTQQILIRYGLQREWTPVVRSGNSAHLAENADVGDFQLTEEDMAEMNSWDQGGNGAVIK
jgi:diketogulonate reductase-like aldo/keto reductase